MINKVIHVSSIPNLTPSDGRVRFYAGWLSRIASEVIRRYDDFEIEIWQLNADIADVMSHVDSEGITYRLFPATYQDPRSAVSPAILEHVNSREWKDTVFHLHAHMRGVNAELTYRAAKYVPMIFTFHNPISICNEWKDPKTQHLRCVTHYNFHNVNQLRAVYQGNIEVFHIGCDFDIFRSADRQSSREMLGLPMDKTLLLTVGRFVDFKQMGPFLEVLHDFGDRFDFLYVIAGDGPLKDQLKESAAPLIDQGKVLFAGHVARESAKLISYLNAADVFVSTSRGEGGPATIMEAMACELPILSTSTGVTAEFMKERGEGVLLDIDKPTQWRDAIENILIGNMPSLVNRDEAKRQFDWSSIVPKLVAIYREAIQNG